MAMLTLTRQQSRDIDRIAIERYGFSGLVLMENAGRGVVDALLDIDPDLTGNSAYSVAILCGKGNNAGDGFVIARHLDLQEVRAKVLMLAPPQELRGDALANYEILQRTGVSIVDLSEIDDLSVALAAEAGEAEWLVDAMLGTGARGEPREPYASAIVWMNAQPDHRLALDVPSGLDCDTGLPANSTVRADLTCTFASKKRGFLVDSARDYLGELRVVPIGIPPAILEEVLGDD